ncbi:hypothetical protein ACB092_09G181200 [Castanea dentata]
MVEEDFHTPINIIEPSMSQSRKKPILLPHRLSDDVLFDVLTRLPVKSLIRFRCVSKSWYSIITKPIFINTHLDEVKSLSNNNNNCNNGYLLCNPQPRYAWSSRDLCTVVCNSDHRLTEISRFFELPFHSARVVGFCNGIFCFAGEEQFIHRFWPILEIYLWNPSIRKFKMFKATPYTTPYVSVTLGLAYHSQKRDYKILRIGCFKEQPPVAEVYTLSSNSWRKFVVSVESLSPSGGSVTSIVGQSFLFFNGSLHSIAFIQGYKFILSFDVNDEKFREIILPQNYLDGLVLISEQLVVFKGCLALIVFVNTQDEYIEECHIWVMKEYGIVESWKVTKQIVPLGDVTSFFDCTKSGELLITAEIYPVQIYSFDPESLNVNYLSRDYEPKAYTANLMESLVLLNE